MTRTLAPGWYGFDIDARELASWESFRRAHRDTLKQRKTWDRSRSHQSLAFLLELTAPLDWSYPGGLPKPAPKGLSTSLQDLTGEPDPAPSFPVQVEEIGEAVAGSAAAGGALIVIGLGALALVALLRRR